MGIRFDLERIEKRGVDIGFGLRVKWYCRVEIG